MARKKAPPPPPPVKKRWSTKGVNALIERLKALKEATAQESMAFLKPPVLLPGVIPSGQKDHPYAMDSAGMGFGSVYGQAPVSMHFPGYQSLALLAQRSEYRGAGATLAQEMTRRWIRLHSKGASGEGADAKLGELTKELDRLEVKPLFYRMTELDATFGRGQIYVGLKNARRDGRGTPLMIESIQKGSLEYLNPIEPMWTAPYIWDAHDPTRRDFFRPQEWWVMGQRIHTSRLLTFIQNELPDIYKPSYNFSGVSMFQMMIPYVEQWLTTRNHVVRMLGSFSTSGIKTDLQTLLAGGDDIISVENRARVFNALRDNQGVLLLDFDGEEFFQFNVPLSGLGELQAQAQEHMAAPTHIPLVKLLGVTPTGLNASSAGEIQVFYDYVRSVQERLYRPNLTRILRMAQMNIWGEIDENIGFDFIPLDEMTEDQRARANLEKAQTGVALVSQGVISPAEERQRIAADPESGYNGIDPEDVPPPPPGMLDEPDSNDPKNTPARAGNFGSKGNAGRKAATSKPATSKAAK